MEFIPIYYREKLKTINPHGDVGIVSLWSPLNVVIKHLEDNQIDLNDNTSRIAVLGTLYGDGFPELLRNLLHNPQINHLMLFGVDLGRSRDILSGFFQRGLELTTCLGTPMYQIVGTLQKLDGTVQPEAFHNRLTIVDLGTPGDRDEKDKIHHFFARLPPKDPSVDRPRRTIPLPTFTINRYPADPRGHTILATTPMSAWKELIFRLLRFGHRVNLGQGKERIELQTVKVTIQNPKEESEAILKEHGFSLAEFTAYQKTILSQELPNGQGYGYGHRLRSYFGEESTPGHADTLAKAIEMIKNNPESRHVYISLWDTRRDFLTTNKGHPCLVSLFFRTFENRLTLTAVFRTHNALRAWPENVYGLIAIQRFVCTETNTTPGAITIMSHSISIDPQGNGLDRAQKIDAFRRKELEGHDPFNPDPNGDFTIAIDEENKRIVVDHRYEGQLLHRYTGQSSRELESQIARDHAVSDIAHALYLGREIGQAETRLKKLNRRPA